MLSLNTFKPKFPKDFLWGAATSSHQVEGNNKNNDWFLWEESGKIPRCGKAADSYNRFEEDFSLAKELGHNTHRLSLEWSRIQPEENFFDENEINHYKEILNSLKTKNIKTVVTLHHFTNPIWFYRKNGWESNNSPQYFAQYVKKIVKILDPLVDYWLTINEPLVYIYNSYLEGIWPPGEKSPVKALSVLKNMKLAHVNAYKIIHELNNHAKVSVAKHLRKFIPYPKFNLGQNTLPAFLRHKFFNVDFLEFMQKTKTIDYIGLNYYSTDMIKFSWKDIFGKTYTPKGKYRKNSLGWNSTPEEIFSILLLLKKFTLPILITENGTTETEEKYYQEFLEKSLTAIGKAIEKEVNVIGYLWWSLIDNYEWDKGYDAHFGLIDINRKIKPFAYAYKKFYSQIL